MNQSDVKKKNTRLIIMILIAAALLVVAAVFALLFYTGHGQNTAETFASEAHTEESAPHSTPSEVEPTQKPAEDDLLSVTTYITTSPEDDGSDGYYDGGNFIWKRQAFAPYYADDAIAKRYAECMNTASEKLGGEMKVYSMIAPLHGEFGLPERFKTGENVFGSSSCAEFMKSAYTSMNSSVTPVNSYNMLSTHADEYIYFGSDHHWTGLGAYYAYVAFARTAGLTPLSLDDCEEHTIEGFEGSFTKVVDSELDLDTVHYWTFPYEVSDTIYDEDGKAGEYDSCYFDMFGSGEGSFLVFLDGDHALEVIRSKSENVCGEKIAVVHESYGNPFIPYLTGNFEEVYSIDFRYFKEDISDFCEENGITNVLFINNIMTAATVPVLESIEEMI